MTTTTRGRTAPPSRGRLADLLRGNAAVAVAIMVTNVATYGFQMVAARVLGPAQYGGVAGLMAMLLIIGVAQLGLQAVAARRVSADPDQVGHIEDVMRQVTYRVAGGLALLLLVASPLVWRVLRLDSIAPALLLALAAIPLTIFGAQTGILQGERRWLPLGVVFLAMGVSRLLIGSAFIVWRPTEGAAMAGVTAALFVPVTVGWWLLRRGRATRDRTHNGEHHLRPVMREALISSQALLAFFVLSNADIVVARNVLDNHDAGLYAGGLILTKAVLFLPQFVVVIAFPAMSTASERRRALLRSLTIVLGLGAVSILGALLLSDLAMIFVGGDDYTDVKSRLWMFALLGTCLAALQMLVYSVLARRSTRTSYLVWGAVVALVVGALLAHSLDALVATVTAVDAVLLAVLLGLSLHHMRDDQSAPAATELAATPPA